MVKKLVQIACFLVAPMQIIGSAQAQEKDVPPKPMTYQVPKGWKAQKADDISLARYQIGAGDRVVTVTVTGLPGTGGGLVANVNRWRNRLGLESLAEKDVLKSLKPINVAGVAAHLVDVTGPKAADKETQRIHAVILTRGEQTWFFKLMGPASLVEEQTPAFAGFMKSVRFEK